MSIKTTKRLALGTIAALVFAPLAAIAPASASQSLSVSTITASRAGTVGVAPTIKIVNSAALAIGSVVRVRIDSAPTAATTAVNGTTVNYAVATVHQSSDNLDFTAIASGTTPVGSINSIAPLATAVPAGTGVTVTLGLLATAGNYTFTAWVDAENAAATAGLGRVNAGEPFVSGSFAVGGAPANIVLSAASGTAISDQANTIFTTSATDASGNATQLVAGETLNITSSGTLAGLPTSAVQVGAVSVTPLTTDTASQTITVSPGGTLPGGIASKTFALTIAAAGATRAQDFSVVAASSVAGGAAGARTLTSAVETKSFAITATGATASAPALITFARTGAGTMKVNDVAVTSGSTTSVGAASATGSVTFTLTTDGFVDTDAVTITGAPGITLVITYAAASVTASETNGDVVAAVGSAVPLTVTVADQYEVGYAGNIVSASSIVTTAGTGGPTVGTVSAVVTGTTGADGSVTLSVPAPAGVVDGTIVNVRYTVKTSTLQDLVSGAVVNVVAFAVSYKTDGLITSMSVGIGGGATTPLTNTASTALSIPHVVVVADGLADVASSGVYTLATASGAAGGEHVVITPTTTPATPVTVTVSDGAHLSATTAAATVPLNKTTLVVQSGTDFYAYATKAGTHTVTINAGGKTVAVQFRASAVTTGARNVALSLGKTSLVPGEQTLATVTVTDAFGNPVAIGANTTLTATATGNLIINGSSTTASLTPSATGVATFIVSSFQAVSGTGTITVTGAQTTRGTDAQFGAAAGTITSATTAGTNGFTASVASATANVSTTAPVVEIVYDKPTLTFVKAGGRIILSGTAVDGEGDIIIYTKRIGTTAWKERAKTLEVTAPGDFNGSIKALKNNVVIRVKQEGTGLFSNQVIVIK